jgi:hypothetical protein
MYPNLKKYHIMDKILHAAVSAGITLLAGCLIYAVCGHVSQAVACVGGALVAVAAGLGKEYGDYMHSNYYDKNRQLLADLLMDAVGVAIGLGLLILSF